LWAEFQVCITATHGDNWREDLRAHKHARAQGCFQQSRKHTRGEFREKEKTWRYDELANDITAGIDAISWFLDADWWTWERGSALFFWHWPIGEQRQAAQDDMLILVQSRVPRYQRRARPLSSEKKPLILKKL
jgi:hypothetical protein